MITELAKRYRSVNTIQRLALGRTVVHRFELLFSLDKFINAFSECYVSEYRRPIIRKAVDAATQSIEYTRCSNATAFVLPFLGHNFGVGEEAGSILEALSETHGDRLLFVHEANVTSAMIRSATRQWDLRVETYETEADLVDTLRLFAGGVMQQERQGELDHLE